MGFKFREERGDEDLDKCANYCFEQNYKYHGHQYQSECWCGSESEDYTIFGASSTCPENGLGASYAMNVYLILRPGDTSEPTTSAPTTLSPTTVAPTTGS